MARRKEWSLCLGWQAECGAKKKGEGERRGGGGLVRKVQVRQGDKTLIRQIAFEPLMIKSIWRRSDSIP